MKGSLELRRLILALLCLAPIGALGLGQHRRPLVKVVLKRYGTALPRRTVFLHIGGVIEKATFKPGATLAYVGIVVRSQKLVDRAYVTASATSVLKLQDVKPKAAIQIPTDGNEPALRYPVPVPPPPLAASVDGRSLAGESKIDFSADFKTSASGETDKLYAVIRERLTSGKYEPKDFDDIDVPGVTAPSTGFRSAVEVSFATTDPDKSLGTFSFTFNQKCATRRYIIYYVWVDGASHVKAVRGKNVGQIEFGPAP